MSSILKVIALIAMVIDHIGFAFYPQSVWMRIIGRLAMPLFAYCVVIGFHNTRNIKKYILRMFIFSCIAQIPYSIIFGAKLNIIFTFTAALLILWFQKVYNKGWLYLLAIPFAIIPMNYGWYGIVTVVIFNLWYTGELNALKIFLLFTLFTCAYCALQGNPIQAFSLFTIPVIEMFRDYKSYSVKLNKYVFYVFYPVHLAVIVLLKIIV